MIRIEQQAFEKLSFHDQGVKKIDFFLEEKILKVYVSGAFDGDKQMYLEDGLIVFRDWSDLSVSRYDRQGHNPVVLQVDEFDKPTEMNIFEEEVNKVTFGGFGTKIHHWIEWTIIGASYYAEFLKYDPTNYFE